MMVTTTWLDSVTLHRVANVPQPTHAAPTTVESTHYNFTLLGGYLGIFGPKNTKICKTRKFAKKILTCKLFHHAVANPSPNFSEIYVLYAHNLCTQCIKIWCNLVHRWQICRQKSVMGHFPPNFRSPYLRNYWSYTKNQDGPKNGTDTLYPHAKFGKYVDAKGVCNDI